MNGEIGIIGTNTEEEAKMAGIEEIEVGEDNTVTMAETLAAVAEQGVDIVRKDTVPTLIQFQFHSSIIAIDVRNMNKICKSRPLALLVIMGMLVLGVHGQNMSTPS